MNQDHIKQIEAALKAVAADDPDRAAQNNAVGFSSSDGPFGHRLVEVGAGDWDAVLLHGAWELAQKYRKQAAAQGIDVTDIPEPPRPAHGDPRREAYFAARNKAAAGKKATMRKTIDFKNGRFEVRFDYDDALVTAIRNVPGREYSSQVNYIPKASAADLAVFAKEHGFESTPAAMMELLDAETAQPKAKPADVVETETHFEVRWPKNDPDFRAKLEAMRAFGTWDRDGYFWKVPLTSGHELAAFVDRFKVSCDPKLLMELRGQKVRADELFKASLAADAEVDVEGLGGTLRPFQRGTIAYTRHLAPQTDDTLATFIADEMGLGKTIQALAVIEDRQAFPAIIVVPAGVRTQWAKQAKTWLPHRSVEIMYEDADQLPSSDIVIAGYNTLGTPVVEKKNVGGRLVDVVTDVKGLAQLLVQCQPQALIVDEGHYAKEAKSRRTRCVSWIAKTADSLRVRLILTGTPIKNRHRELLTQLKILGLVDAFGGEYRYLKRYCDGGRVNGYQDWSASINGDELWDRLRTLGFVRRTSDEVKGELPEKPEPMLLTLDSEKSVLAKYRKADADVVAYIEEQIREALAEADEDADESKVIEAALRASRAETLVKYNKLRQLAGQAKVKSAIEWIKNFLENTADNGHSKKLLVFAWHSDVITAIQKAFDAEAIRGGMSDTEKDTVKENFINDPSKRVLVGNILSAGTGLDGLQYAAQDGLFLEYAWTPGEMGQAIGRLRRMGQEGQLRIWWAQADGCEMDEDMVDLLFEKQKVLNKMDPASREADAIKQESVLEGVERRRLERLKAREAVSA